MSTLSEKAIAEAACIQQGWPVRIVREISRNPMFDKAAIEALASRESPTKALVLIRLGELRA